MLESRHELLVFIRQAAYIFAGFVVLLAYLLADILKLVHLFLL